MRAARYTNAHQDATVDERGGGTLPELQRLLDFAYKYKLIDRRFDASDVLAPGFPIAKRDIT